MATVIVYDKDRMQEIEDTTITSGNVNAMGSLILATRTGAQIDAGVVRPDWQSGTADQYYRGDKTWQELDKVAVGLENVDNTSDAAKPISTLQAAKNTAMETAFNAMSKGLLLKKSVFGNSGGIADAIVDNIPTFTFKANRKYRIVWDSSYLQSNTGDLFFWSVNFAPVADAAAALGNLTVISGRTKGINGLTGSTQHTGPITCYYEPTADLTTQIKFRLQRVVGGGTVILVGNANELRYYNIYDDGAQTVTELT